MHWKTPYLSDQGIHECHRIQNIMLVFFDVEEITVVVRVPPNQTVNQQFYLQV
jgi:hypothetical protein